MKQVSINRLISRRDKFWSVVAMTILVMLAGRLSSLRAQPETFSPRLTTPRIAPVPEQGRTEAQRLMLASRPDRNLKATPLMVDGVLYTPHRR